MPVTYRAHTDIIQPGPETNLPQPHVHAYPGGTGQASPFFQYGPAAPGFPIQQYPNAIHPLPPNASNPYPLQQPQYAYSGNMPLYAPYTYNQRAATTGSVSYPMPNYSSPYPMPSSNHPFPSSSYPGMTNQGPQGTVSKSHEVLTDDCFNIFWLFFLLGPLTWPCGAFGVCSSKPSERMAGVVSGVCLILVIIAAIVVITQAPSDSGNESSN